MLVAVTGIALPYLVRLPGMFFKGSDWLTSFFGNGPGAVIIVGIYNAVWWIAVVLAIESYRHLRFAWFPILFGAAFPILGYSTLDLASSSTAAIALFFIPLCALPLVFIGWLAGKYFDWRASRLAQP
ncbi:MAG TPA: hypothetical protein VF283_11280 [Bryobacteraceae bacterium]